MQIRTYSSILSHSKCTEIIVLQLIYHENEIKTQLLLQIFLHNHFCFPPNYRDMLDQSTITIYQNMSTQKSFPFSFYLQVYTPKSFQRN